MHQKNITHLLEKLNDKQRQAVEAIHGAVLVVAGPGTGKTHLLTTRIAHILSATDTSPQSILCLTFTENGATEMRTRLAKIIGQAAYQVHISTFHGFCQWVMDSYPDAFQNTRGDRVLADDLQKAILYRQVIDHGQWPKMKPFKAPYSQWKSFQSTISHLKRENHTPASLRLLIPADTEKRLADPGNFYKRKYKDFNKGDANPVKVKAVHDRAEKMQEIADLWQAYEKEMEKAGLYDFDDMIAWTVQTVGTNPNLKADLQERFLFTLVDEYQDTNNAQNTLLWHLTDYFDNPNLFAVGDDDQAIFRFQGASLQNMLDFKTRFPQGQIIELSENYRSGQSILDSAYASVSANIERLNPNKKLTAAGDNAAQPGTIIQATLTGRWSELVWIAEAVKQEIASGIKPEDIAILCRRNADVFEVAQLLRQFGLPVRSRITQNIFDDEYINAFIQLLHVITNPFQEESLIQMLHAPWWNIPRHVLMQLTAKSQRNKKLLVQLSADPEKITDPDLQALLQNDSLMAALNVVYSGQKTWGKAISGYAIAQEIFYSSGIAKWLSHQKDQDRLTRLNSFKALLQWMHKTGAITLEAILDRVVLHKDLAVPVFPNPLPSDKHAVNIMTAHKSKGSEFHTVIIPGMADKTWGNRRKHASLPVPELTPQNFDENEDERRLFFVALTRAKQKLIMTYCEADMSGKAKSPSIYWHEIPDALVQRAPTDETESQAQELLPVFFAAEKPTFTEQEKNILQNLVDRYTWSATGLQNYLTCPKKFLYVNLLGIPFPQNQNMAYGSAMHKALEDFFKEYKRTKAKPAVDFLLEQYQVAVLHLLLPAHQKKACLVHGQDVLTQFYAQQQASWSPDVITELSFRSLGSKIDGIPVTGVVDKLELNPDGTATCVDYKTGRPGKVVPGERLWRQLVFYSCIIQNTPQIKHPVNTFALQYLTADKKGAFKRVQYSVTEEDQTQLKQELKQANENIKNLHFPDVPNLEGDEEITHWQSFGTINSQA